MAATATLLTDCGTMRAATPTAATIAKMSAPAGPIMDIPGSLDLLETKVKEIKLLATQIKAAMDGSDPILTTLQTVIDTCV